MTAALTLFALNLTGKRFAVRCEPNDTIQKLKEALSQEMCIPANQFLLIFAGKQLDPERTIDSYRICTDATLHVVTKLRGD